MPTVWFGLALLVMAAFAVALSMLFGINPTPGGGAAVPQRMASAPA